MPNDLDPLGVRMCSVSFAPFASYAPLWLPLLLLYICSRNTPRWHILKSSLPAAAAADKSFLWKMFSWEIDRSLIGGSLIFCEVTAEAARSPQLLRRSLRGAAWSEGLR